MAKLFVYFDESCGVCKKVKAFLSFFNFSGDCLFCFAKDMNFPIDSEPMNNRYYDMYSFDGTNFYKGYDSYYQIFKRMRFPFLPLYFLMKVKLIRKIGEKLYRKVADSRNCKI
jgi:predicted DCC family thiol-disulfide oxidoreductase YuxK